MAAIKQRAGCRAAIEHRNARHALIPERVQAALVRTETLFVAVGNR